MKIIPTRHYQKEHEKEFPFDMVQEIIKTTKGKKIGKNLVRYDRITKKYLTYVLCSIDEKKNVIKVINAKRVKKRRG